MFQQIRLIGTLARSAQLEGQETASFLLRVVDEYDDVTYDVLVSGLTAVHKAFLLKLDGYVAVTGRPQWLDASENEPQRLVVRADKFAAMTVAEYGKLMAGREQAYA